MKLKVALALALVLTLASCTNEHKVTVSLGGGTALFSFSPTATVNAVIVTAVAQPSQIVWKIEASDGNGPELDQLRYGAVPSGLTQSVAAHRLKVGQLYRVALLAKGGGGSTHFVIADSNLSRRDLTLLP